MKILKSRLLKYMGFLFAVSISLLFFIRYIDDKYQTSFLLIALLFLIISGFFFLKKDKVLFDPMVVFSAYYYTVVLSGLYLICTNFETSVTFSNTSMTSRALSLFNISLIYFIAGYLCALLGYFIFVKERKIKINLENRSQLPDGLLQIVITCFLLIGLTNFIYVIYVFAGGNILLYINNIALRQYEFAEQGSTLGYLFAYIAMYLWFFKLLRKNTHSFVFLLFLLFTGLMKASTGRILQTIVYMSSFVIIYYYVEISRSKLLKNSKYIFGFLSFGLFGILFYFFRILSSLSVSNKLGNFPISELFSGFIYSFGYFAIDKGNLPNIPILMKIIDCWADDIGFLYGQSFLKPFIAILPTSIRPEPLGYSLGLTIKNTWFLNIEGGGLPPTGVGEMFANFGILGPFIGLFIFGALCAWLYNFMLKTGNYWILAVYSQILIGFILIYAKGEFFNLSLMYVLPIAFTVISLKLLVYVSRSNNNKNRETSLTF